MPFLGKDWRSPGWSWTKTEQGWKRTIFFGHELEDNNREIHLKKLCNDNNDNLFVEDMRDLAIIKRKKDFYNNNTKSQFVFRDKWIYVQKGSTKELFQLIARSQLTSLSGAAQKNYFNILEKIVRKVLEDYYNPRLVKDLLQDLSSTLHSLTIHVGRCVLVGNVNIWLCRLETIVKWQQELNNLQIPKQIYAGMSFNDLPLYMQNQILCKLSDACDIINLGQATPTLHSLSENRTLWKKLCQFHFSDKPYCRNLALSKSDNVDWKLMYFTLQKHYPMKEQYGDTLHFCKHCSILFWKDHHVALLFKDFGHPCTAHDPDSCLMPISPQHFIDLFKF
ncbi:F-box only protein 25 isoform X3 [Cololabis saira]|uniref:F-box only protein 25 isoform X3 n=1 Tax=Cololabis saira TaxID=129043 RepID=UPI002AD2A594|nr:F-box only protein 25 isoform X3 [Cololabis saira]